MPRRHSRQTGSVLAALAGDPSGWRYGYELGKQVGVAAGTLYPILMRLCDRGLLETMWETNPPPGRPRRHLYRISETGRRAAAELEPAAAGVPVRRAAPRRRRALEGAS